MEGTQETQQTQTHKGFTLETVRGEEALKEANAKFVPRDHNSKRPWYGPERELPSLKDKPPASKPSKPYDEGRIKTGKVDFTKAYLK